MLKYMRWINLVAFLAMIGVNALANLLPLGGKTTGEISAAYPTLVTPAPYTFFIWGAIYLLMAVYVVLQLKLFPQAPSISELTEKVGIWFCVSCILNIAWIFCWHYEQTGLSVLIMFGLLISLIILNYSLDKRDSATLWDKMTIGGFQIYLGWISAATIANVSFFLLKTGWSRFGISEEVWAVIILIVGAVIGCSLSIYGHHYYATLAMIWAYWGILVRHISPSGYNNTYKVTIYVSLLCIVSMTVCIIMTAPVKIQRLFLRQ